MKYIRFQTLGIVMFEDQQTHAEMAERLGDTPVSAGFVYADAVQCYGESASLDIAADAHGDTRRATAFMQVVRGPV